MGIHKFWYRYGNCIIAALTITVNALLMSLCFDFYYDLNDDVMIKDVLAGVYSGIPDGHNMQMLYILGAALSLCYRLCRGVPWYAVFLWLCQMGSLYLVGCRLLGLVRRKQTKAACMAVLTLFIWGILLPHMVAVQYTLTCTMLAAAAIFLFLTTEKGLTTGRFMVKNIPSVILIIIAYQLRTEMLLLVFPLVCLAGLYRWAEEERFFIKNNYIKYGTVIACILFGMLCSRLIDFAAYGDEDWKAAVDFFNKRTEVYDFHYDILTSGEHAEYLSSIGISAAQQELLANYNFGLDEEIDEKLMGDIAEYASSGVQMESPFTERLFTQVKLYIYRLLHRGDFPYNMLAALGYVCVFIGGIISFPKYGADKRKWNFLWQLILLAFVRTMLWMYIMMKGRDPERITHSLYLAETMLLWGLICMRLPSEKDGEAVNKDWQRMTPVFLCLISLLCLSNLTQNTAYVSSDMQKREEANIGAEAISRYCRAHPDNFYFEDVYSTVGFSQKMFKNVDNSLTNYDIMGGWMCKTPLYKAKLKQFGIETTQEGLLKDDGVYFIALTGTDEDSVLWMKEYYEDKGFGVSLRQVDLIDGRYAVYKVVEE